MKQPNILFIMTDQMRADAMSCSGDWVKTPNLDRIAREGVRFSNAVTNSPVCIPARVSLATGRYPHNTAVWNNTYHDMSPDTSTWMQAVREAGYRTSVFGKTHLHHHQGDLREREHLIHAYGLDDVNEIGGPRASTRVGSYMTERWAEKGLWRAYKEDYDERFSHKPWVVRPSVLPLEEYADVYVGQRAREYLEGYEREEPWFCWVSFGGPHEPWDTPEPYASMYDPADMPRPAGAKEGIDGSFLNGRLGGLMEEKCSCDMTEEEIAAMRANYAANVTLIDDQIGDILDTVEQRNELDNTVIVFCSDHGEMNGDHGLIYKNQFLNGALRVPLLLRTPETLKRQGDGRVCDSPVEWFDLGPTMVELSGGEIVHQQFARSLCPVLDKASEPHRPHVVSEIRGELMIMDAEWKLVVNDRGEPYLLFNQREDFEETDNCVNDPKVQDVVDEMMLRLFQHLVQTQVRI
ncbi:MAG: sulfatase [Planctomycetota bacterium]